MLTVHSTLQTAKALSAQFGDPKDKRAQTQPQQGKQKKKPNIISCFCVILVTSQIFNFHNTCWNQIQGLLWKQNILDTYMHALYKL